jgi:hypothetical protein
MGNMDRAVERDWSFPKKNGRLTELLLETSVPVQEICLQSLWSDEVSAFEKDTESDLFRIKRDKPYRRSS